MVLKVEIVQSPQGVVPAEASKTISEQGGSFGRGDDNTWVLDDPERFLSSRHCEFSYEAGSFYLTDVSTNGTFVNGSAEPMGRGSRTVLKDGDSIELGEYRFIVRLVGAEPALSANNELDPFSSSGTPFGSAPLPVDSGSDPLAFGAGFGDAGNASVSDLGAMDTDPLVALDKAAADPFSKPSAPLEPGLDGRSSGGESFPYGQNTFSDRADPLSGSFDMPAASSAGGMIPEDWEDDLLGAPEPTPKPQIPVEPEAEPVRAKVVARPKPAAPAARRDISQPNRVARKGQKSATQSEQVQRQAKPAAKKVSAAAALEKHTGKALLESMGLDTTSLSAKQQMEIAATIGELMPVVVEGMMRVLRSRASIKNEFRMSVTTIQPVENNPLKFSADAQEALENMFIRKSKAYKEPVDAFSEGFNAIAEHQVAIIAGIRAAFTKMIEHFDPQALETQFDKQNKGVNLPGMQKARYWSSYTEHYQSFIDNMEQSFQNLFGDEFVRAYEDQLFKLMSMRNNDNT